MILLKKQKLCYPMQYVNISQGSNGQYSHKGIYAVDLCGKDSGAGEVFAQGNGKVVRITDRSVTIRYNNVVGQSGTLYAWCDVCYYHNTADRGISVGQTLKRGQVFMHEGKLGNATGNHIHVSVTAAHPSGKTVSLMPERMFTADPAYNRFFKNKSAEPIRVF